MITKSERNKVLFASSRNSQFGRELVGRLLTPAEIEAVAGGGDGSCDSNSGYGQGGGTFGQTGGSYNQNSGSYNMVCS